MIAIALILVAVIAYFIYTSYSNGTDEEKDTKKNTPTTATTTATTAETTAETTTETTKEKTTETQPVKEEDQCGEGQILKDSKCQPAPAKQTATQDLPAYCEGFPDLNACEAYLDAGKQLKSLIDEARRIDLIKCDGTTGFTPEFSALNTKMKKLIEEPISKLKNVNQKALEDEITKRYGDQQKELMNIIEQKVAETGCSDECLNKVCKKAKYEGDQCEWYKKQIKQMYGCSKLT